MANVAIIIGATGLVGQALTDQLAEAESVDKIITFTRRPAEHPCAKVHNHVVNFDRMEDYVELFQADLLFSCLGTTRKQAGSLAAQRKVDLDYPYKVAQLAAEHGVRHYVLVSSSGAKAGSNNAYLKMKGELEQRVKVLPFKRISIFQPSLLLGPRIDFRLGENLAACLLPLLCRLPGLQRFRPITGQQVAAKMVQVSQERGEGVEWFRLDDIFLK